MCSGTPPKPKKLADAPVLPTPDTLRDNGKKRKRSTLLTGPNGALQPAENIQSKSLLGS